MPSCGGETACRWEPLAGAQPALHDRVAITLIELPVQRLFRSPIDRDQRENLRGRSLHAPS